MNQRKRVSFRILAFLLITTMLSGTLTAVYAIEGIFTTSRPDGMTSTAERRSQATTASGIRATLARVKRCT